MISIKITHTKDFMNKLLLSEAFDAFLVREASIATFFTAHLEGKRNKDFYTSEELEELGEHTEYARWAELKPLCLQIIKGKKTPVSFKFVFKLSQKNTEKFIQQTGLQMAEHDVSGLFLHILFEQGCITCTSGTALNIFTMDKTLDKEWDTMVERFLKQQQLDYELL